MKWPQERVGRDDLVEHLDFFVFLEELLAPILVAEVLDQVVHVLVIEFRVSRARDRQAPCSPSSP